MTEIRTEAHTIRLVGDAGPFAASLTARGVEPGLAIVTLRLSAAEPASPPRLKLAWTHPAVKIHAHWSPSGGPRRGNDVYWGADHTPWYRSKASSGEPVICLHDLQGQNRLTFACSDALNPVLINAALEEETALFRCAVVLFSSPTEPLQEYRAELWLDTRDLPYYESLRQVAAWWAATPGQQPAPVPETARLPMYSTWYSFHQRLDPAALEQQCALARELGCGAIIVDDGWQTSDNSRGYAYCGDWNVTPDKIPDMRAHVARVHELKMKYILWYSVPFVGKYSAAYARFEKMFLAPSWGEWWVLDPRFPEVRAYLVGLYERAVREWDIDGFKLDFIDLFEFPNAGGPQPWGQPPAQPPAPEWGDGRDIASLPEAVTRLLADVWERLRPLKPDLLIEFRQSYTGPHMRRFANMLRAGDCPDDAWSNRLRTLDVRLLSGGTPAHSDMLMWHPDEPVESAAMQLIHVLFAVPQVSVLLDRIPPRHQAMLRFWLGFWREQRDVLLDGRLMPERPDLIYPCVLAQTPDKLLAAVYAGVPVRLAPDVPETCFIVNGTLDRRIIVDLAAGLGRRILEVRDCCGEIVQRETIELAAGLHALDIPPAGVATLAQQKGVIE